MSTMNLQSTQFVDYLVRRMASSGVPVPAALRDMAERCDTLADTAHQVMRMQKNELERRLADLVDPTEEECLHLGNRLDGFGQQGLRLEKLGAQIALGKSFLQDGIVEEIARVRLAEKVGQ